MTDESSEPGPEKSSPQLSDTIWLGTACALSVLVAGGIGYGLDSVFGTLPWLTFVGLTFGVVSAVLIVVTQVRKFL